MEETRGYRALGRATFREYVKQDLKYSRTQAGEFLRVAKRLKNLPRTVEAYDSGEISWSCFEEISRVAGGKTEAKCSRHHAAVHARLLEVFLDPSGNVICRAVADAIRRDVVESERRKLVAAAPTAAVTVAAEPLSPAVPADAPVAHPAPAPAPSPSPAAPVPREAGTPASGEGPRPGTPASGLDPRKLYSRTSWRTWRSA
jgi:hypothetical protein